MNEAVDNAEYDELERLSVFQTNADSENPPQRTFSRAAKLATVRGPEMLPQPVVAFQRLVLRGDKTGKDSPRSTHRSCHCSHYSLCNACVVSGTMFRLSASTDNFGMSLGRNPCGK